MNPVVITAWVIIFVFSVLNGMLIYLRGQLRAAVREITADNEQCIRDQHLAIWARDTTLTITDKEGLMISETLANLYEKNMIDHVWIDPIMVSVWSRTTELLRRFPGATARKDTHE